MVRGEAGIGKTALLEHLVASASDLTVTRAVGVESEMELAFASVHQLCMPLLEVCLRKCTSWGSKYPATGGDLRVILS